LGYSYDAHVSYHTIADRLLELGMEFHVPLRFCKNVERQTFGTSASFISNLGSYWRQAS